MTVSQLDRDHGESLRNRVPIACPACGVLAVWHGLDELEAHFLACGQIELGLLVSTLPPDPMPSTGALGAFSSAQPVPPPLPYHAKRVKCEVCAGTQQARAYDARVGKPSPDCWACGGTGWYDA